MKLLGLIEWWLLAAAVLAGPWFFGAWERWWFWPFAALLGLSFACFCMRRRLGGDQNEDDGAARAAARRLAWWFAPFLVYAGIRALLSDVAMDAERSFLTFLLPCLAGAQILFGMPRAARRRLLLLAAINILALGLYGLINHWLTGSARVLWGKGYPTYLADHRASGPYYCPDHFAFVLELGFALGLAAVLSRDAGAPARLAGAALCAVACAGVAWSKSRGGGLTLGVVFVTAVPFGFGHWPAGRRGWCQVSALAAAGILLALFLSHGAGRAYGQRFQREFGWEQSDGRPLRDRAAEAARRLRLSVRGVMYDGALRAWRTAPLWGIGAGMHRHRWPEFSSSPDGDRERGVWPSRRIHDFHSYEAHSDWLQLLEEYGLAGLLPALAAAAAAGLRLLLALRDEARRFRRRTRGTKGRAHALLLGGLLAWVAAAFHSLGDFSLQMPANGWLLAVVLAVPLAEACSPLRRAAAGAEDA